MTLPNTPHNDERDMKSLGRSKTRVSSFFLDSGAHHLYREKVLKKGGRNSGYSFYDTREFWNYVDTYATFVKANLGALDHYANVDVIFNPERTWRVQKYLEEKHGLSPVPVVHHGTSLKWLRKYIEKGYDFIGIGGRAQREAGFGDYREWADSVFDLVCDTRDRTPCVKTHGFAATSYWVMTRYPWWSVDSASWAKSGAYGSVYIPHKRKGKFTFSIPPYSICFSEKSKAFKKGTAQHFMRCSSIAKMILREWIESLEIPIGDEETRGVTNWYRARGVANMKFFQKLAESLPEWPWPFKKQFKESVLLP